MVIIQGSYGKHALGKLRRGSRLRRQGSADQYHHNYHCWFSSTHQMASQNDSRPTKSGQWGSQYPQLRHLSLQALLPMITIVQYPPENITHFYNNKYMSSNVDFIFFMKILDGFFCILDYYPTSTPSPPPPKKKTGCDYYLHQ